MRLSLDFTDEVHFLFLGLIVVVFRVSAYPERRFANFYQDYGLDAVSKFERRFSHAKVGCGLAKP